MIVNPVVSGAISGGAKVVACGVIYPFEEPIDIEFSEPVKLVVAVRAIQDTSSNPYNYKASGTFILGPDVGTEIVGPIIYVTPDGLHLISNYTINTGGYFYYVAFA